MKRFSQFFVLATLMVVFGSQSVSADGMSVHGYFNGVQFVCAVHNQDTSSSQVVKCCRNSTHLLSVDYTYREDKGNNIEYKASCKPRENAQVSLMQKRE